MHSLFICVWTCLLYIFIKPFSLSFAFIVASACQLFILDEDTFYSATWQHTRYTQSLNELCCTVAHFYSGPDVGRVFLPSIISFRFL